MLISSPPLFVWVQTKSPSASWQAYLLYVLGNVAGTGTPTSQVVMFRLTSSGGFDTSFGASGLFGTNVTNYPAIQMNDFEFSAAGQIIMGGSWAPVSGGLSPNSYYTAIMAID
jgi:hypothetical protein